MLKWEEGLFNAREQVDIWPMELTYGPASKDYRGLEIWYPSLPLIAAAESPSPILSWDTAEEEGEGEEEGMGHNLDLDLFPTGGNEESQWEWAYFKGAKPD